MLAPPDGYVVLERFFGARSLVSQTIRESSSADSVLGIVVTFTTPSANMMMRETGICLFLASVGLAAGDGFVAAMTDGNGPLYMALGVLITVIPLLIVGVIARRFLHINYHSIVGLMAGATTDPPALAYAGTLSERNSSAVAYSTVYPLAMFLRILMGQLILVILWPFL